MISAISVVTLRDLLARRLSRNVSIRCSCARSAGSARPCISSFLALVVINLVGGFQALGTLLAVGLMMLPAAAARFWTSRVGPCARWPSHRLRLLRWRPADFLPLFRAFRTGHHPVGRRDLSWLDPRRHTRHRQQPRLRPYRHRTA